MKLLVSILFIGVMAGALARADEKAIDRCPIETGIYRDGGSEFMKIPAHGERPGIEIVLDRRIDTKTPNTYYIVSEFRDGQPMKVKEVLRALQQAESVLLSKYGMEFVYGVSMNPLVVAGNISEDEFVSKIDDLKFMERIHVSEIIQTIQQYRAQYRTEEVTDNGQHATPPQSKTEVGQESQPESEGHSR
jgi:hypothetical protein